MGDDGIKKIWLDILNAWGPWLLNLILPSCGLITGMIIKLQFIWIILIVISLFILSYVILKLFYNPLVASFNQWKYGKLRGLWKGKGLKKQINRSFKDSRNIRIKVTRGTELVEDVEKNINIIKELKILNDTANEHNPVKIQILLMAPCFKLKHVEKRYQTHRGKYDSEQNFLNSWKSTLEELVKYESDYCKISVRFYCGGHSRWRFYICSNREDEKQIVLLSNYDDKTSGSATPMYKIIKGEKNIGAFMDTYFDEIWNTSIDLEDYIEFVNKKICVRLFCEECKNTNIKGGGYCENDCKAAYCNRYGECIKRVQNWDEFLKNLSRMQRNHLLDK